MPTTTPSSGSHPLRIAIVTPYSWTYGGGVNRHVEALAEALIDRGHELRVLAPWDPPDRLSRALHRAPAEPAKRPRLPDPAGTQRRLRRQRRGLQPVLLPRRRAEDAPRAARRALRRRTRARAARADARLGRLLVPRRPRGRHLPRLLDQADAQRGRQPARSPPQVQPAPRPDRRLGGRRLDRAALVRGRISRHPQRRRHRCAARRPEAALRRAQAAVRGQAGGAKGPPGSRAGVRGAGGARSRASDRDRRRLRRHRALRCRSGFGVADPRLGPDRWRGALAPPPRGRRALRALARRRELRHGPDRGLRGRNAGDRIGDRGIFRRGHRRNRRRAGAPGRPPAAGGGASAHLPRACPPRGNGPGGARNGLALRVAARRRAGRGGLRAGRSSCPSPPPAARVWFGEPDWRRSTAVRGARPAGSRRSTRRRPRRWRATASPGGSGSAWRAFSASASRLSQRTGSGSRTWSRASSAPMRAGC